MPAISRSLEERFWSRVDRKGDDECWEFLGAKTHGRYGSISVRKDGKIYIEKAHRVSVRLAGREIPDGMVVMHTCDNPPCVNPAHLVIGTQRENMQQRELRMRGRHERKIGENNWRTELREIQVHAMRDLYRVGWSIARLAELFDSPAPTISAIVSGRNWKHA